MTINLLERARAAKPKRVRGCWGKVYPAFKILVLENDFQHKEAVRWLITEKQIKPQDEQRAMKALSNRLRRELNGANPQH